MANYEQREINERMDFARHVHALYHSGIPVTIEDVLETLARGSLDAAITAQICIHRRKLAAERVEPAVTANPA